MNPLTDADKDTMRKAAAHARGREMIQRAARDNTAAIESQRLHLAKCRTWLDDAERDMRTLEQRAEFFVEVLGGLPA